MKLVELLRNDGPIFWQSDTIEKLQLVEAQTSQQHQRTELCSVISQVSEPHVGSRGAQSNRIGWSTRCATCIKPQDYDGKNPARLRTSAASSEGRAEAEAAHSSAQLGSAQAACKQASVMPRGAKVWRQRRLLSELFASPPPSCSSSLCPPSLLSRLLPESNTSPPGFTSITSESGFLNQLPSGRCENVVLPRWKKQTACVQEAPAAAWFPWQPSWFPLCRHTFRLGYYHSIISARIRLLLL